jgi:hypothetical protein
VLRSQEVSLYPVQFDGYFGEARDYEFIVRQRLGIFLEDALFISLQFLDEEKLAKSESTPVTACRWLLNDTLKVLGKNAVSQTAGIE